MKLSLDIAISLLRIAAGSLIMTHGLSKLMRIREGNFGLGDPGEMVRSRAVVMIWGLLLFALNRPLSLLVSKD